jgi:hypothetical protein
MGGNLPWQGHDFAQAMWVNTYVIGLSVQCTCVCCILFLGVFTSAVIPNTKSITSSGSVGRSVEPSELSHPGGSKLASTAPSKSDATSSSSPDVVMGVLGMAIKPIKLSMSDTPE